ncbi:hypothetical protein Tco_0641320 [Tanacetum coccineum]
MCRALRSQSRHRPSNRFTYLLFPEPVTLGSSYRDDESSLYSSDTSPPLPIPTTSPISLLMLGLCGSPSCWINKEMLNLFMILRYPNVVTASYELCRTTPVLDARSEVRQLVASYGILDYLQLSNLYGFTDMFRVSSKTPDVLES